MRSRSAKRFVEKGNQKTLESKLTEGIEGMQSIAKAPSFVIPTIPDQKRDFKKWEGEMKAYLNYYGETDKILTGEERDPPRPREEDYLNEEGELPDNFEGIFDRDLREWSNKLTELNARSRFLATTLVQACHANKKASELISTVRPGDWKKIWEILKIHYCPMGAANKVDLMKKFLKIQKETSESLTEFMGRFDNEVHNMTFQGVEVPEELMLSILQQSVGLEHETYMRILIQQKTSFEKIKEELLTYESSYKTEENREVRYIPVNVFRSNGNEDVKKTALKSQRF